MENFESARKIMVDNQLRPEGITDLDLLAAMGRVPREEFVPESRRGIAYIDDEHKLSATRTMSAAAPMAKMVQLAEIDPEDVVLDVGCGTGYSTAVIAELASAVVGIEEDQDLVERANETLVKLDIGNAAILSGKFADGVPSEAPFDVIIIEGTVEAVPETLFQQLRDGGRLVAAIRRGGAASASVFVNVGGRVAERSSFNVNLPAIESLLRTPEFAL